MTESVGSPTDSLSEIGELRRVPCGRGAVSSDYVAVPLGRALAEGLRHYRKPRPQQVDVPREPEFWPRSIRLLLLDDNPEVGRALEHALQNSAVSVSIVEDHSQAERLMKNESFDALIVSLDDEQRSHLLSRARRSSDIVDLLVPSSSVSNKTASGEMPEEPLIRAMQSRHLDTIQPPPSAHTASDEQSVPPPSPPALQGLVGKGRPFSSLQDLERHVILCAFEEAEGNLSQAARTLGLPRSTLRDRLKRFGVRTSA